jgi:hypothetical protein
MVIALDLIDIESRDIVADRLGRAMFGGADEELDFDVLAEAGVLGGHSRRGPRSAAQIIPRRPRLLGTLDGRRRLRDRTRPDYTIFFKIQ